MTEVTSTPTTGSDRDRLTLELDEAREQLDATNDILAAIGRSASDVDAVLGAVVESARRLCKTDAAVINLLDGDTFRVAAAAGVSPFYLDYMADHPIMADRASVVGRVTLDRRAQQIQDVLTDPGYGRPDVQRVGGFRTLLGVPMLIEDEVIGVLLMWRNEIGPFTDHAIELVTTFAAQAAIAIRNADLVHALQIRTSELADKVEQLEALHEIGRAVSSSLDLDEVLTKIVSHAVQLTDTDGGSLLELDLAAREFTIRAAYGTSPALLDSLHRAHIALDSTLVGRACLEAQPQMVHDLETAELDPHLSRLKDDGWRSVLAVPMQHEGTIVGALVVRRRSPGSFSDDISGLLQTFASQSALAIVNARLYRELEQKSRELQVASRHKSEFLASMSHELRTPLNAVIGFSEVLLQRMFGDLNERQEDYLRDILSSGRHLLELLNDILDLSKVESGRMQFDRSQFDVLTVLQSSLAQVRGSAQNRSIALSLEVGPDVGEIETDELRFKQVVLNLLSNAVKFTPEDGAVDVRASLDGDGLRVTVSDNGIGIAPEDRERIFDSFEQAGRARNQSEGTGLGLTLSRRIVERLGGRMWLESEVGVGSTFGFVIPLGARWETNPSGAAETGPVVVIVEDDHHSIELLSLYLESAGVRPVVAHDGAGGLAAVRQLNPSAMILDIRLPGMDGWGVLRELKSDPVTASVPVVVITMLDERPQAMSLGAAEYLIKPVGREAVVDALGRVGALPSESFSDVVGHQGEQ